MQVLLTCLRDNNREVRYYSSKALYKLQFRASAMPLSLSLFAESDDEIKEYLINTMIAINDAGGYKGIRKILLQDENYRIRILASYALGRIKSNWSSSILLEGKSDKSKEVRAEICNSLGLYYDNNILKELIAFVNNDPETYVRSAALFSIKKIGMKAAILPLFDRYTAEIDPIFKEQIRFVLRALIKEAS
jgi:HEAT repeat protein